MTPSLMQRFAPAGPLRLLLALGISIWTGDGKAQQNPDEFADPVAELPAAEDPPPPKMIRWAERPVSLELQMGVAGPLGLVGGALDVALLPRWSLGAGVGLSPGGPQVAAFTRYRLVGNDRRAFFVETAFSAGNYRAVDLIGNMIGGEDAPDYDDGYIYRVAPAFWAYGGAGYEMRWKTASFRAFGGIAPLLNPGSGRCVGEDSEKRLPCSEAEERYGTGDGSGMDVLPYVGVAFGKTFGL